MKTDNVIIHYPEMGGELENDIQAWHVIGKKPYRVTSKNLLPLGQGIEANGVVDKVGANNTPNKRAGWYKYYMTDKAFLKLSENNKIVLNCNL